VRILDASLAFLKEKRRQLMPGEADDPEMEKEIKETQGERKTIQEFGNKNL
jgi:hypothetical protein